MTKEQMIQLLDTELDAMNKHRSNIERIKKEGNYIPLYTFP